MILHVPHASSLIPATDREDFLLGDGELAAEGRRLVDAHTDTLFGAERWPGAVLAAKVSRLVVDVERFADNQLDNLVGPIALYPDALLAQVLVAATFPDQVEDAARWVREHGTSGIDEQSWDVSVKSVAHYPSALNMMADKGDWTATLGRAYAYQSSDVMAAVQRMRRLADTQGNLVSTAQQQVVRESNQYEIGRAHV